MELRQTNARGGWGEERSGFFSRNVEENFWAHFKPIRLKNDFFPFVTPKNFDDFEFGVTKGKFLFVFH